MILLSGHDTISNRSSEDSPGSLCQGKVKALPSNDAALCRRCPSCQKMLQGSPLLFLGTIRSQVQMLPLTSDLESVLVLLANNRLLPSTGTSCEQKGGVHGE